MSILLPSIFRRKVKTGLYPLKPSRDLVGVANLIESAFSDDLDDSGWLALREMRFWGYFGLLLMWYDYMRPDVNTYLSGFVWLDEGKVVGNVTVNRPSSYARRWFISNVAVAKTHRRQGIGWALMEAALEYVELLDGKSVLLHVRNDNVGARNLYSQLGFRYISANTFFYAPRIKGIPHYPFPEELTIREHHLNLKDAHATYNLARQTIPQAYQQERALRQRDFRLNSDIGFNNFWRGLFRLGQIKHWVVENEKGEFAAVLNIIPQLWGNPHKMSFMVHPHWRGILEYPLLSLASSFLLTCPRNGVGFEHPTDHKEGIEALKQCGYQELKTHILMKKEIRRKNL